jgi:2'-5' RNA ligase
LNVRAFIALELDADLRAAIGGLMADVRHRFAGLRWVRPEGMHLTLRFLGDASPAQIEGLRDGLRPLAARCPSVHARAAKLGVFPERGAPRVLWLGLDLPEPILTLQAACEAVAVASGFAAEKHAFRPHLTLGRWRERASRPELPPADLGPTRLETLTLFRSELRPGGAIHTALARFPLEGG